MAVTFNGGMQFPIIIGNNSVTQHLFALENAIGSRVDVYPQRLVVQNDTIAALASVMPQVKISRGTSISGGVLLDKSKFDTLQSSDSFVRLRSAMGEGSAITASAGTTLWQQYVGRMPTVVEQVLGSDENALPRLVDNPLFRLRLRPGESMLVSVVGAAASNAALTDNWSVNCQWEEDSKSTFAISGTITLSGSPVAGARVMVMESDDVSGTNMFLRETIVTGAGGTWASSILTGKIGAAFVQYESGGTYYTAPGSPFLS
jgi:hypothetical protein